MVMGTWVWAFTRPGIRTLPTPSTTSSKASPPGAARRRRENLVPLHGDKGALENGARVVHEDGGDILKSIAINDSFFLRPHQAAGACSSDEYLSAGRGQGCLGTQTRLAR